jgi:hypothetical protein
MTSGLPAQLYTPRDLLVRRRQIRLACAACTQKQAPARGYVPPPPANPNAAFAAMRRPLLRVMAA